MPQVDDHDLITNQFWTIHPSNTVLHSAKVFLLSHIAECLESPRTVLTHADTKIILNMIKDQTIPFIWTIRTRAGITNTHYKCNQLYLYIITAPEGISLDHGSISDLSELEPFHSDFDLTSVANSCIFFCQQYH